MQDACQQLDLGEYFLSLVCIGLFYKQVELFDRFLCFTLTGLQILESRQNGLDPFPDVAVQMVLNFGFSIGSVMEVFRLALCADKSVFLPTSVDQLILAFIARLEQLVVLTISNSNFH